VAFVVWDGCCFVSIFMQRGKGTRMLIRNSCPREEQCLCDVYGLGSCG
jgi:hypothetical protein